MSESIPPYVAFDERFAGAVETVVPRVGLQGWALDLEAPGEPLRLQARAAGRVLAEAHAMMDRPDLDAAVGRLTRCGFLLGWSRFDAVALAATDPDAELEVVLAGTGARLPLISGPMSAARVRTLVAASPRGDLANQYHEVNDYADIVASGLFDRDWYRRHYGEGLPEGMPPLLDYLLNGEAAGRRPNLVFDPKAYAAAAGLPPDEGTLLHYVRDGATAGVPPSFHFDDVWYARAHGTGRGPAALAHYLGHRAANAPNPWFDRAYYARVSGVTDAPDLYEHFVTVGFPSGLMPSERLESERGALTDDAERYIEGLRRETTGANPSLSPAPGPMAGPTPLPTPAPAPIPDRRADATPAPPPARPRVAPAQPPRPAEAPAPSATVSPRPVPAYAAAAPALLRVDSPGSRAASPAGPRLSYRQKEAYLRDLDAGALARVVAEAERQAEVDSPARVEAALTLTIARGLAGDRRGAAKAAALLLSMSTELPPGFREEAGDLLISATHALHEGGGREESQAVYRLLHARGVRDYAMTIRLLEAAVASRDINAGSAYVRELEADHADRLNPWARLAISRYYHLVGDAARAAAVLRPLPVFPAISAGAEAAVLHRLIESEATDDAVRRLASIDVEDPPELYGPRLRLAIRLGDAAALSALLDDPRAPSLPDWQLGEAIFRLTVPGGAVSGPVTRVLARFYGMVVARGPTSLPLIQARIHVLLHGKRWEELGAFFEEVAGTPFAGQREILLRRLEYACFTERAAEAERIYNEHFQDVPLNKSESLTVLRLLSETKRWTDAGRVLLAHVEGGEGFGDAVLLAMRILRKAELHEAVLEAADRSGVPRTAELEDFLTLVNEDFLVARSARVLSRGTTPGARLARFRSSWVLPPGVPDDDDTCTYLCTNRRYFLSLLTFLCSFLGQSPQAGSRVFVFLDDDVPRHWHGSIAMIAARFGRAVEVVLEADFVPKEVEHRVDYGFFAGGNKLSRAAYFRLYAARYLLDRHAFRRAAYIDTDTVCRADLSDLFALDLGEKLIAAANEDQSPDVIGAARRIDLDPRAYFNSGVLLLRFDSPAIRAPIEEAIRISEQEPERLTFHDQCALNIAFRDRVAPLPSRFNFFLRPGRERNGYMEDGAILHFLDRPKPWDIVFDRNYREAWRVWALVLGSIVPQSLYLEIFAEANRE